ncbi:hypothetical protein [Amycolatopsis sp. A1MSW2902]|uniref:hypothetical protein n=1 Tax=Amycolatopsis sp. A1MSW2902 TaxID=687413 RepID=UPI00307CF453
MSARDRIAAATRIVASHPEWSDRAIAALADISPKTVAARRSAVDDPHSHRRIGRDGRTRGKDIGKRRLAAVAYLEEKPNSSIREIAREANVSIGTARDVRLRVRSGRDPIPERGDAPRSRTADAAGIMAVPIARTIVDQFKTDPALRMPESGRGLVRMIDANRKFLELKASFVANVPGHCSSSVAAVARFLADEWATLADTVENGSERSTKAAG